MTSKVETAGADFARRIRAPELNAAAASARLLLALLPPSRRQLLLRDERGMRRLVGVCGVRGVLPPARRALLDVGVVRATAALF